MQTSAQSSKAVRLRLTPGILSTLQNDIESGTLAPGTPLDERTLAVQFGVSRTPIRDVLRQLAALDLVKLTPNAGARVVHKSVGEIRAMLEYISEMEPICAKLAARRVSPNLRKKLEDALSDCEAHAQEGLDYGRANLRFHEVIYDGCHNAVLAGQIRVSRRLLRRYRVNEYQSQIQIQRSLDDHNQIAKAIMAGDERRAAEAMMKHIPAGSTGFSEFLAKVPVHFFDLEVPMPLQGR